MSFGNTIENTILDSMIGSTQLLGVNTLWIGLSTATIGDDASGLAEPSGNGYARIATVNSTNAWAAAASGVKRNAAAVAFPTATGSWGLVSDFAVWRAATSDGVDSLVGKGVLGLSKNVTNGDVPQFGVGSLSITLD
jgi:hypothetical protein